MRLVAFMALADQAMQMAKSDSLLTVRPKGDGSPFVLIEDVKGGGSREVMIINTHDGTAQIPCELLVGVNPHGKTESSAERIRRAIQV